MKSACYSVSTGVRLVKMADSLTLFTSIGLTEQKAKETLKNEGLSSILKDAIAQVRTNNGGRV